MKKVISVTLNGSIFMIEEDALLKLTAYIDSIKRHYGPDGKEISDDIEANIAEKFKIKNNDKERAIEISDVEEVIGVMGTVDQMDEGDEMKSRETDKKEEQGTEQKKVKRLYRDDNNAIAGGVCTGLAAYFSIDVVIVRLIFVALTIMNGIGIAIYLVMWLIVPLAKTSMQKLEMQGEPINLKNIEEVVKEKSEQLRDNSQRAYVSLKEKKSVFVKILNFPIVVIEALIKFLKGIANIILPFIRFGIGLFLIIGVFFGFIFSSFWAIIFLFKIDSPLLKTDFPLESLAGTKAFIISVVSLYSIGLILMIFAFLLAISVMSKKKLLNWTVGSILFTLLAVNITVASVYVFELASEVKTVYDKYITENTTEKIISIDGFNSVSGEVFGSVRIEKGEKFSILLKGLKNDIENAEFSKEATSSDGIINLLIESKNRWNRRGGMTISRPLELLITMPELKKIDTSGFWGYSLKGFDDRDVLSEKAEPENKIISDGHFSEMGIAKKVPGMNGEGLFIIYQDEADNEKIAALEFDADSLCGDKNNQIVCMALSVSDFGMVNGQEILIKGEMKEGVVTVDEFLRIETK